MRDRETYHGELINSFNEIEELTTPMKYTGHIMCVYCKNTFCIICIKASYTHIYGVRKEKVSEVGFEPATLRLSCTVSLPPTKQWRSEAGLVNSQDFS